jgi:benzoyl-CoA reductase/2-hydroxyglutaryl-CoA dehydratase subunit BcrC/BadD/HgdB
MPFAVAESPSPSGADPIAPFRDVFRDRMARARAWTSSGRQVVGYACDNVPGELVEAAGLLPYRLIGDPTTPRPFVDRYIAPNRDVVSSAPAFVDALFEGVLSGACDVLDYLVIPHTRKSVEVFYGKLTAAGAAHDELALPELAHLDKSHLPFFASNVFNRNSLAALRSQLEAWTDAPISASALAAAIEDANEGRLLLAQVNALRVARRPRLAGAEALLVYAAAGAMPRSEHNALLRDLLARADELPHRSGPRVLLAGSPVDHPGVYDMIESSGATVVAEDHCWGGRCAGPMVAVDVDPFDALAAWYHEKSACSIEFPLADALTRWHARARAAHIDGAVFRVITGDELHMWEVPDQMALLADDGIPSLHLSLRAYDGDLEPDRQAVAEWLEQLRP